MAKNSFVIRTGYYDVVKEMSDKQAGLLFKAIFNYAAEKKIPELSDVEVKMAFRFVKQDLDYDEQRYDARVEHNRQISKLGGAPKGNKNALKQPNGLKNNPKKITGCKTTLNDVVVDVDSDVDNDYKQQLLTAEKSAEPKKPAKPKRELNDLQKFSNAVIENFESEVQTDAQKAVWFKRNCRCLSDILKFCNGDIDLALGCIYVCSTRLQEANLRGGYEAVCRNLPDYYADAKKLQGMNNANQTATAAD